MEATTFWPNVHSRYNGTKGHENLFEAFANFIRVLLLLIIIIMFFITIADKRCKGQSAISATQDSTL